MKDKEIKHLLGLRMRFKAIRSAQEKLAEEHKQSNGQQLPREDYESVYNIVNATLQSLETKIDEQIRDKTKNNFKSNMSLSTEQTIKGSNSQNQKPFLNQNLINTCKQQQQQLLSYSTSPSFAFNNNSSYLSNTNHQSDNAQGDRGQILNQKLHPFPEQLPDEPLNKEEYQMQIEEDWQKNYFDSCERESFESEDEEKIIKYEDFSPKQEEEPEDIFQSSQQQYCDVLLPQNSRSIFEIKQLFTENNKKSLFVDVQLYHDTPMQSVFRIEHNREETKQVQELKEQYLELQSNNNDNNLDSIDEYLNFVTPEKFNCFEMYDENPTIEANSWEIYRKQLFNKLKEEDICKKSTHSDDDVSEIREINRMSNSPMIKEEETILDKIDQMVLKNITNCQGNRDSNQDMKCCRYTKRDCSLSCSKQGFESFDQLVEQAEEHDREVRNVNDYQKDIGVRLNSGLEQEERRVLAGKVEESLESQADLIIKSEDCSDKSQILEAAKEQGSCQDPIESDKEEVIEEISEDVRERNEKVVEQNVEEENTDEKQSKKKRKKRKKRKKQEKDVQISTNEKNESKIEEEEIEVHQEQLEEGEIEVQQEQLEEEIDDNGQKEEANLRSYIRGPYNFYSEELKKKAIKDYLQLKDIKRAAQINDVKVKNLKRWIYVGHKRKEGGGRKKEDPVMEDQVFAWLENKYSQDKQGVTRNQIRVKALQLSNKQGKFKASKGWLEKFFFRYNCKHMSRKDLNYQGQADDQEGGDGKGEAEVEEEEEQI